MDADRIRGLKSMLTRYLKQFDGCFARKDTRAHLSVYVEGQLSDLDAKSVEPIAVHAGVAPRTLQEFLTHYRWDEDRVRGRLRQLVIEKHAEPNSIGIIDETSDVKKGDKTPGVQRQWCGTVGKTENCMVTERPFRRTRGRGRKTPRVVSGSRPAISVKNMLKYSPALRDQPWVGYHVKDGRKGPIVWEAKHTMITIKDEDDLPGIRLHWVVARNMLDPEEVKYFVSNAPPETPVQTILLVGFSRWRVERCFEDQKQEIGLDQWEGRRYLGLKRHLILSCISYLFLATVREQLRGKKSGAHRLPGPHGRRLAGSLLVA